MKVTPWIVIWLLGAGAVLGMEILWIAIQVREAMAESRRRKL